MSATTAASRRLDLGAVVSDTIAVLQRNFRTFALAGVLLVGLPDLVSQMVSRVIQAPLVSATVQLPPTGAGAAPVVPALPQLALPAILIGLAVFVLGLVLQAGLFYGAAKDLQDGERVTLGELVSIGFKRFLPLIGLYILMAIALWIGMILLIVPGVFLALRWSVAGPAVAVEGKGVFAAMKRSAVLTKGHRWTLFLLGLIVFAVLVVIEVCIFSLMGGFNGIAGTLAAMRAGSPSMLFLGLVVSPLFGIAFGVVIATFGGVLFQHLRSGREGLATAAIAEVFA
jgi:Membrane domain of glycerophosphoryl diester phosphodiesterase